MYETLVSFLTGCLHQDWDADYQTDTEAAVDYASAASIEHIKLLLGEVQLLLALEDDEQIESIVQSFGLDYISADESNRVWLGRLSDSIAATAAQA